MGVSAGTWAPFCCFWGCRRVNACFAQPIHFSTFSLCKQLGTGAGCSTGGRRAACPARLADRQGLPSPLPLSRASPGSRSLPHPSLFPPPGLEVKLLTSPTLCILFAGGGRRRALRHAKGRVPPSEHPVLGVTNPWSTWPQRTLRAASLCQPQATR